MKKFFFVFFMMTHLSVWAQSDSLIFRQLANQIMLHGNCYDDLRYLCKKIGNRISGSESCLKAINWGAETLTQAGADKVWLQPAEVPYWVRGAESLKVRLPNEKEWRSIRMLSIGNSEGTNGQILEAPIVMVEDYAALKRLTNDEIRGKIIFFNHRFPQEIINSFEAYGKAGSYRWTAPNIASSRGALAVIIRSLSTGDDDEPHTGSMRYADSVRKIPAVAIGNHSADRLEEACNKGVVKAQLQSHCTMRGTKMSFNVIGELKGSDYPNQLVVVGGHLDSWDVGEGAQDDGAGIVQSIEVLRTFKALKIRPKRTLRVVLFTNEENGLRGGIAYADSSKAHNEHPIFALESDAGGFSPRGFSMSMPLAKRKYLQSYRQLFLPYGVYDFEQHGSGADISPLEKMGVPCAELMPDPQRYFDYHHTANDVFEIVNHRELKLGAVVMSQLVYLITQYGL
ncbi:MAG: M20/M25/M40 family metallo-hydrolase [Bacteroidetes bacterium]|nr:M20/M25/M40 family metallo-hydrolase [Bacteroidota bacterium]